MTGSPSGPTGLPRFGEAVSLVEMPRRAFVEQIMGLPFSLHVRGPRALSRAVSAVATGLFTDLRADDLRFSLWKPASQVSRIRRAELRLADADERVQEVAALCRRAEEPTEGAFSAWRRDCDGSLKGDETFDPTGLVKGWSAECAFAAFFERLQELGAHDALLSAGGDVVVRCARVDTPDWTIGIEDPRDRGRLLDTVSLRTGAVATSGTAARGQHIIDPASGAPVLTDLLSATVIGPSLTWADVYATAAFVRGSSAITWIDDLIDHAAVLITASGARLTSS